MNIICATFVAVQDTLKAWWHHRFETLEKWEMHPDILIIVNIFNQYLRLTTLKTTYSKKPCVNNNLAIVLLCHTSPAVPV